MHYLDSVEVTRCGKGVVSVKNEDPLSSRIRSSHSCYDFNIRIQPSSPSHHKVNLVA
jgi:hypothetical protein